MGERCSGNILEGEDSAEEGRVVLQCIAAVGVQEVEESKRTDFDFFSKDQHFSVVSLPPRWISLICFA